MQKIHKFLGIMLLSIWFLTSGISASVLAEDSTNWLDSYFDTSVDFTLKDWQLDTQGTFKYDTQWALERAIDNSIWDTQNYINPDFSVNTEYLGTVGQTSEPTGYWNNHFNEHGYVGGAVTGVAEGIGNGVSSVWHSLFGWDTNNSSTTSPQPTTTTSNSYKTSQTSTPPPTTTQNWTNFTQSPNSPTPLVNPHLIPSVGVKINQNGVTGTVGWGSNDFYRDNDDDPVFGTDQTMQDVLNETVKGNLRNSGITTSDSLIDVILGWIRFFLPYASILAFAGIVYAGFLYVTAFAQEDQVEKAKNILVWSILGLILIFSAYAIVSAFVAPV